MRGDSEVDRVYNEVDDFERRMTNQRFAGNSTVGSQGVYSGLVGYGGRQEEPMMNMRQSYAPQRVTFRENAGFQSNFM